MKLRYTPQAIRDLDEIESYIRETLKNPEAALDTIIRLADTIELLKEQPYLGAELGLKIEREIQERYLVIGHYIVVYLAEDAVSIIRILDGRTDYMKAIFN